MLRGKRVGDFLEGRLYDLLIGGDLDVARRFPAATAAAQPPALKIGRLSVGTKLHTFVPPSNRLPRLALAVPGAAGRVIDGKKAARAAPMSALEPISACSAAMTSGRCNRTSEDSRTRLDQHQRAFADSLRRRRRIVARYD